MRTPPNLTRNARATAAAKQADRAEWARDKCVQDLGRQTFRGQGKVGAPRRQRRMFNAYGPLAHRTGPLALQARATEDEDRRQFMLRCITPFLRSYVA